MQRTSLNVLLVDDDAEYASIARHNLRPYQQYEFNLTWVDTGEKAMSHLNTHPETQLILMDYYLPVKNGLEIVRQIFESEKRFPVILLTSNKDFRIVVESMKYGVEDYLLKEDAVDTMLARSVINVVERAQLKKQIEEIEKQKLFAQKSAEAIQELVVTMCHEFNNPLAAIKISADILCRQSITESERSTLGRLNQNISLLEKQIVKLRDFNTEKSS